MYDDTTFFSLNKKSDWEKGTAYHLRLGDDGVELERTERFGYYRTLRMEQVEGPRRIADLAVGGNGKSGSFEAMFRQALATLSK